MSEYKQSIGYDWEKSQGKLRSRDADPVEFQKIADRAHKAYHNAPEGADVDMHRANRADSIRFLAQQHAKAAGLNTSEVLQNHGFHPVTGHSLRPKPE